MSKANPRRLAQVDLTRHLKNQKQYRSQLEKLQDRVRRIQTSLYFIQARVIIVFEGWDASGKGGAIRRLTEKMDPRGVRVRPIGKPHPWEIGQHYLKRFWTKTPYPGSIAVFDRSWYGRVLVERVEGLASLTEWSRAYQEINDFEKLLTDDGVIIIKLFMHISQEEQLRRFGERLENPDKHWKLTPEDLRNREKAAEYLNAYDDMFDKTDTAFAPWFIVEAEHKWYARIRVLTLITEILEARLPTSPPRLTDAEIRAAKKALGIE